MAKLEYNMGLYIKEGPSYKKLVRSCINGGLVRYSNVSQGSRGLKTRPSSVPITPQYYHFASRKRGSRGFEMSDSDMDIDDDEVDQKVHVHIEAAAKDEHTIGGASQLLVKPILVSNSQKDENSIIINEQALAEDKGTLLRFPAPGIMPTSFTPDGGGNEPEQKRAALLCRFFAKGWCNKGSSCRFLHVKENSNGTSQQQAQNNMAGSSGIQSNEERRKLENKEGVRVSQLSENGKISLHTREDISFMNLPGSQGVFPSMSFMNLPGSQGVFPSMSFLNLPGSQGVFPSMPFVNPPGSQRVFPSINEMRYMSSFENMGRENLKQTCGADVTDNRSIVMNNSNSFTLRSSFVPEHRPCLSSHMKTEMGSSGPAWTGSLLSSVSVNDRGSTLGHSENGNSICGSGSLPTVQGIAVSSDQDAEGNTTINQKKVSSTDWEPSEPFQASFTIPPYILPSSDALYDPFTDAENLGDKFLNSPLSSKGEQNSRQQRDGDSTSGLQAMECKNDDKSSSCSQNQHQETFARRDSEAHGVVEGVATSVVDQNDTRTTPSKEISSAAAAENRVVLKRNKPAGHDSWHRSDGSSYKKTLKSDEIDGEVRSDTGMKVMRQFRNTVVETVKEMVKPLWRDGRLSKDVHNMIVKKATEKVVTTAVQFHQMPTDTESIEQYLSLSATKIVKLVEGYVEKYGKQP